MTRKNISEAINHVSNRHVEEVMNFREQMEDEKMKKENNKKQKWLKWSPVAVAATLAVCLCLSGVTALAATGRLQGFFKDVFGWGGAVVGTTYEQASDEIEMSVVEVTDQLVVELAMVNTDKAPYSEIEVLGIESYKIVDESGKVVEEGTTPGMTDVADGKVTIGIYMNHVPNGAYKLVVTELTGWKKADQPLSLNGSWECEFTK